MRNGYLTIVNMLITNRVCFLLFFLYDAMLHFKYRFLSLHKFLSLWINT